ncbi:baseplate assembly protein [Roseospira marina]|uniref:Baseplate assembly protein n=1 Tax=Roseospira marina TaxID=140057 RepID=A0A5M6I4D6_9PROT|nr:baseplate J/gp47 family protein [Roseospira marina]KAA5603032.1 baseplate assembly protein [Roseospira marina]MBB4313014.1 phage-related baseplate assembly protein [Roseospira marina]MBB5089277.1 phage-related baseplate assembly protein [Roseospira marina]
MTAEPRIDLSRLTAPDVVEALDFETILAALKADFVARYPAFSADLESEPVLKLLEVATYRELLVRARVNDAARANLLAEATGADLDHLAALLATARRVIVPADPTTDPPTEAVLEPDDELRARAQLAMESLTVAGSEGAYRYHTLAADGRVRDARIDSPVPGQVRVTVLSREGDGAAPNDLLTTVAAHLSADDVRPLTDTVIVQSATIVPWRLEAVIHCYPGPAAAPVVAAARAAAARVAADLHALDHDVTLSALYAALHQPGVQRVDLIAPTATVVVGPSEAPWCVSVTVTEGPPDV